MDVAEESEVDCSDGFYLMTSDEAPSTGDKPGPYLHVTSPVAGDMAEAGETYTIEVSFFLLIQERWSCYWSCFTRCPSVQGLPAA